MVHYVMYKIRLVAKSHSQVAWMDFNTTLTLIAKFTIIRTIVAIKTKMVLEIYQMDVKNVFLNKELEEDI